MITKRLSFKADSILSDTMDTISNITNIPSGEATNTNTHFSYASPTGWECKIVCVNRLLY